MHTVEFGKMLKRKAVIFAVLADGATRRAYSNDIAFFVRTVGSGCYKEMSSIWGLEGGSCRVSANEYSCKLWRSNSIFYLWVGCLIYWPMPRQGISLASASLYLGWEMAYTSGFRADATFAATKNNYFFNSDDSETAHKENSCNWIQHVQYTVLYPCTKV